MINKLITFLIISLLITVGTVYAKKDNGKKFGLELTSGVGSIDIECQDNGFDFGIAKWEYDDGVFVLSDYHPGYITNVTGDDEEAYWTSDPRAAGVLTKEGSDYFIHPGGTSGTVNFAGVHGISHITLCGSYNDIPEFTTLGAALALAGVGLFIYKKRR